MRFDGPDAGVAVGCSVSIKLSFSPSDCDAEAGRRRDRAATGRSAGQPPGTCRAAGRSDRACGRRCDTSREQHPPPCGQPRRVGAADHVVVRGEIDSVIEIERAALLPGAGQSGGDVRHLDEAEPDGDVPEALRRSVPPRPAGRAAPADIPRTGPSG